MTANGNTALIVIDVQESFRQRESWQAASDPDVADKVALLVEHARLHGRPVVWVLHAEPGSGTVFDPALGHVRLIEGLAPAAGEPVLTKTAHNAFTTTNLQQILTEAGVRELIVCGIRTEQCVETTARVGSDLGYQVVFVTDATTTNPVGGLGADAIIERTEAVLRDRFARIATVAELEAELGTSTA